MSPELQRTIAEAEAAERREAAKEGELRQLRTERLEENAFHAAVQEAISRGIDASKALLGREIGHTRGEFIAMISARQDIEDAQAAAREQVAFRKWQAEQSASWSGDTSVHVIEAERSEEQQRQEQRHRNQVARGRAVRRDQVVQDARKAAFGDTAKINS
jgi:hypothetical protein